MKHYQPLLELFGTHLEKYQHELDKEQPRELYDPANYILSLGGKRIRPLLCLTGCDLFDKDPSLALNAALSVELFHNFSLIHDDILDKAPLRRGMPTVHTKWNDNIAILSGDVMLVKAFGILSSYSPDKLHYLLKLYSKTAIEVCEGQQMDMNFESSNTIAVSDYIQMITFKTAVLLACSLKMGAICADASDKDAGSLYAFGKHIGIAFQLMDDLLDVYGGDNFGKQTGGDIVANKKTFLLLKAFELADESLRKELEESLKMDTSQSEEKVKKVITIFDELNIRDICKKEADKHTNEAIEHLKLVNASEEKKKTLENMALSLLGRTV